MITSVRYIHYIVESLNILRQAIISKGKLGLTSDNVVLENFMCEIINIVYGYDLSNLNEEKSNFPGFDLGDKASKLGFQITATKTASKINESISKICDDRHTVFHVFNKARFFILTKKQESYSINSFDETKLHFDPKEDILDFDDLYKKSLYLSVTDQKKLVDYLTIQLPEVTQSIGEDFYNPATIRRAVINIDPVKWKPNQECSGFYYLEEHNLGFIPQVSIQELDNEVVMAGVKVDEKWVRVEMSKSGFLGKIILS